MIGTAWNTEGEKFPVGAYVRTTDTRYDGDALAGIVGRVAGTRGRIVGVRYPADVFARAFPYPHSGPFNVPAEFAGPRVTAFDADWLVRIRYVRAQYLGPEMARDGSTIGARIRVTGARGDRMQMTVPYNHASTDNYGDAVTAYAVTRLGMVKPMTEDISARHGVRFFAITDDGECTCSEEYGPCEFHADTLIVREGASLRTADELGHEFLTDVAAVLGAWPSDDYRDAATRIGNALADNRSEMGTAWLPATETDSYSLADLLADTQSAAESALSAAGLSVYWEDGYRIMRITGGPLA
jgi:hypothetical protein